MNTEQNMKKKLSVNYFIRKKQEGGKITALTAYDSTSAKFAESAGIELILVGDSLGMTVLGYKNTIPVTLEQSLHHCAAVARGTEKSFVIGDMPFMTYHTSERDAKLNAARYLQDAGVDGVKIEGGKKMASTVDSLVTAGVPVMGHIGLLPQNVLTSGGYKIAGRTAEEANKLLDDAVVLERAGVFAIVLEGMPAELAAQISSSISIPTIGIGAGPQCDGQIQVINDILGLFTDFIPKHTKRYAELDKIISEALKNYVDEVKNSEFPTEEHSF